MKHKVVNKWEIYYYYDSDIDLWKFIYVNEIILKIEIINHCQWWNYFYFY